MYSKQLYFAVAAVATSSMKTPFFCPYCEQTSMRRWNLSTHVIRKHQGRYNPFPDLKDVTYLESHPRQPPNLEPSNSLLPKYEISDALKLGDKSPKVQNVIKEIRQMNGIEITFVMMEIKRILINSKFF